MDDEQRHSLALNQARWRVSFLSSLLDAHRALPGRTAAWEHKEADGQERLSLAEADLKRLEILSVSPQMRRSGTTGG